MSALTAGSTTPSRAVAQEQPLSAPHGTNLRGTDGSETSSSVLSFGCSYVFEGEPRQVNYHRVSCRFATTGIARPSAEQVTQRLRDLDAPDSEQKTIEDFASICKGLNEANAQVDAKSASGPERVYHDKLSKACADRDAVLGKEALRYNITELWAKTCEAFNYGVREYEFQRVDDTTWRAMEAAAAGGAATIRTIWRKRETNAFSSWNYKQVTSGDPSCIPAPFGECAKDSTNEWTTDATVSLTGCQYFS